MNNKTLYDLKVGSHGIITDINTKGSLRRRLMDLGFTKGTNVKCVLISPLGDPKAYYIKGTTIALRKEDAEDITVK